MSEKLEYDYFIGRKPFYNTLNKLCDFDYSKRRKEKSFFGIDTSYYSMYIDYDMNKLVDNYGDILLKLKKTKAYKTCDTIRKYVDELKEDPNEYANVKEFNHDWQCIFNLSMPDVCGSFNWNIKGQYSLWE